MLDSSPVALPSIPRPLKRSASTASLPTPPRTHRKHARRRSRGPCDSDSEDALLSSNDEAIVARHKKRRTRETKHVNEDAFWLGEGEATKQQSISKGTTTTIDASQAAPLLYRRRQAQLDVAPVSPPPSHRRQAITTPKVFGARKPELHIAAKSPPVTPKMRSSSRRALRDSPDNPFLATPENQVEEIPSPSDSSANPSPHGPLQERPTIAYVFRGVRREFKNPLYNHALDRPFSPPPESKLPIDHPDYSPPIHCIPKRLFADGRPKRKKPTASKQDARSHKRARHCSPPLNTEEDVGEIRPLQWNFGPEERAGAQTLDQEFKDAGESVSL